MPLKIKIGLIIVIILFVPLITYIFENLYTFGIQIGENWRIFFENAFFS